MRIPHPTHFESWKARKDANPTKANQMTESLQRQLKNGAALPDLGPRIYRLLRMTNEIHHLNGDKEMLKLSLGMKPEKTENQLPEHKSLDWYSTEIDTPGNLPTTREARKIRDRLRKQGKKILDESDTEDMVRRYDNLEEELLATYGPTLFS